MPASMEDYWKEEPRRSLVGRRKAKDWTGEHSTMMLSAYQVQPASTIYPLEEKQLLHQAKWQILKNRTIHHALTASTPSELISAGMRGLFFSFLSGRAVTLLD